MKGLPPSSRTWRIHKKIVVFAGLAICGMAFLRQSRFLGVQKNCWSNQFIVKSNSDRMMVAKNVIDSSVDKTTSANITKSNPIHPSSSDGHEMETNLSSSEHHEAARNPNAQSVSKVASDAMLLTPALSIKTITSSKADHKLDSCFKLNSKEWLQGQRIGNVEVPDESLDHMMHPHQLLNHPNVHTILDQTLCHESGRFRNISYRCWNASDPSQIHDWEFRLLYLSLHRLFHSAAFPEYQMRQACGMMMALDAADASIRRDLPLVGLIGNFDFECPHAKFLVTSLASAGMGDSFRAGAVPSIYMALLSGRIPLFIQSMEANGVPRPLRYKLSLASCERHDAQCVFLPISPCVLTQDDLRNASMLNRAESNALRMTGYLKKEHEETRVLVYMSSLTAWKTIASSRDTIRRKVHEGIIGLLDDWKLENKKNFAGEQWNVWMTAANSFRDPYTNETENGFARTDRTMRAALFYLLRPNRLARREISQHQLTHTTPLTQHDSRERQYYGLPILGVSDKCNEESTCLSFDRYMEFMISKWHQYGVPEKRGTILLTSDDRNILSLRFAYTANATFPFDFVVNEHGGQIIDGGQADAIMISSLSIIKRQLQATTVLVGNCCSNFHSLLLDLAREGCGPHPELEVECLDDHVDPRFRICCQKTRDAICNRIRAESKVAKAEPSGFFRNANQQSANTSSQFDSLEELVRFNASQYDELGCLNHEPMLVDGVENQSSVTIELKMGEGCGPLRREWRKNSPRSKLAREILEIQSDCSLSVRVSKVNKKFGIGSSVAQWSEAMCVAWENGTRLRSENPMWLWLDQTHCNMSDAATRSPWLCYFPKLEYLCEQVPTGNIYVRNTAAKPCTSRYTDDFTERFRAASLEYMFREVSPLVIREAQRQVGIIFGSDGAPDDLITIHVRWGDKSAETELLDIDEYIVATSKMLVEILHRPDNSTANIFLATEDPVAVKAFVDHAPTTWKIYHDLIIDELDQFRPAGEYNAASKMAKNTRGRGGVVSMGALLVSLEANYFVLTTASGWSRILNQIRMSIIDPRCGNCTRMIDLNPLVWR